MTSTRFFGLLGLALALGAQAQTTPSIEVFPPVPDAGTAIRITVQGEWPDSCTPEIQSARIEGRDILIEATPKAGPCTSTPHDYTTTTQTLASDALRLVANGVYRLRFLVRPSKDEEPELHAFRLFYAGNDADPGFVPETGFWWPESGGDFDRGGPGLGAQMEVQARTLSVNVFGYASGGRASWYFGAGALTGHIARIDLSQLNGGAGPFERYRAPKQLAAVGTLHLDLISPSRATLWFARPRPRGGGLDVQVLSMVRFRFAQEADEAWLGRWVVLAEREDGFPTLRIDFATVQRGERDFTLSDASGAFHLRCETIAERPNSPPMRCELRSASGEVMGVDFDHVALNELRGWTGAGQRIVALKLNR